MSSSCYNVYFVVVWCCSILGIPSIIGIGIYAFIYAINDVIENTSPPEMRAVIYSSLVLSILILFLIILLPRLHDFRLQVRVGAFPSFYRFCCFGCCGEFAPTTEDKFKEIVYKLYRRHGNKMPSIIGGGWGYFLNRRSATSPRVFTHRFKSASPRGKHVYYSGITIAHVNSELAKQGLTLPACPTMQYISIASWVSCACHGNEGDLGGGTNAAIASVRVADMATPDSQDQILTFEQARTLFEKQPTTFVIIDVEFAPLRNDDVYKRAFLVNSAQTAADWLSPGAQLRVLFFGAARDEAIAIRWTRDNPNKKFHRDPHFCSRMCLFLQTDVFSAVCGWREPLANFNSVMTLREANTWVPFLPPIFVVTAVCSGHRNFELFFKLDVVDGIELNKFVREAIKMHQSFGGRSEVRYGELSSRMIHWDLSLTHAFDQPFLLLKRLFKLESVALHPGKWDLDLKADKQRIVGGVEIVPLSELESLRV